MVYEKDMYHARVEEGERESETNMMSLYDVEKGVTVWPSVLCFMYACLWWNYSKE